MARRVAHGFAVKAAVFVGGHGKILGNVKKARFYEVLRIWRRAGPAQFTNHYLKKQFFLI